MGILQSNKSKEDTIRELNEKTVLLQGLNNAQEKHIINLQGQLEHGRNSLSQASDRSQELESEYYYYWIMKWLMLSPGASSAHRVYPHTDQQIQYYQMESVRPQFDPKQLCIKSYLSMLEMWY